MTVLDTNVVAVVLPRIARDLGAASFADVEWVVSTYVLCFAALLLPAGSIADRFGQRKVFLCGIGLQRLGAGISLRRCNRHHRRRDPRSRCLLNWEQAKDCSSTSELSENASTSRCLAPWGGYFVGNVSAPIESTTSLFNESARAWAELLIAKIQFNDIGGSQTYISLTPTSVVSALKFLWRGGL